MNNDSAAGGIITLIFGFLLAGILFLIIGFGIDRMTLMAAKIFVNLAASQMRYDIFNIQLTVFRIEPFILLIGLGINYWVNEMRQESGSVALGTITLGCGEMIILTIFLAMMDLFGGYAIDYTINFLNGWHFIAAASNDMFTVIQYLGVVFYAFMFLLTVAVVAQFIILCVQTVDYAGVTQY